jgi:hypothetical protein
MRAGLRDPQLRRNLRRTPIGALNGEEVEQLGGTANAAHSSSSLQTPPALLHRDPNPVSAVVCVDLDYAFVARPVSRARGVLAVPADDWRRS